MRILLFLFFILTFGKVAFAQISVTGNIRDSQNQTLLERAVITILKPDSSTIIGYSLSDAKGRFKIEISSFSSKYLLKISLMGFKTQFISVKELHTKDLSIFLSPQITHLKEIFIKPTKIFKNGDTISYNVDAFKSIQDRTIADVLKKLPGIDVQPNGTILYNGKAINKFYIEGLNLLDGKYNLATNNLGAKDVATVEILENHQPIKALKNEVFSDRAALNLKLKSASKAKWIGSLEELSGVTPLLYSSNNVGIRILPANQNLSIAKANNAGFNIVTDLKPHTLEDLINGQDNNIDNDNLVATPLSFPNLSREKFLFNQTFIASTNQLIKLKNDFLFKANLSVANDYRTNRSNNNTLLYVADSVPIKFSEDIFDIERNTSVEGNFNLNRNIDTYYLNNQLDARMDFERAYVINKGTSPNTQNVNIPNFYVKNDFNLIKRISKNSVKINFFNYLSWLPQDLTFSQPGSDNAYQKVELWTLFSHLNFALGKSVSNFVFNAKFGAKLKSQDLTSQIASYKKLPSGSMLDNHISFAHYAVYVNPKATYNKNNLDMAAELPISLNVLKTGNIGVRKFLFIDPSLNLRYKFNPYFSTSFDYRLANRLGDIQNLNTGYLFNTYRSLKLGNPNYFSAKLFNASLSLAYRNPVKAVFANVSGNFNPTVQNQIGVRSYIDYLTVNSFVNYRNTNRNWSLNTNLSKGFDLLNFLISFSGSYSSNVLNSLQADQEIKSLNDSYQVGQKTSFSINDHLNLGYQFAYRVSNLSADGRIIRKDLVQLSQSLKLGIVFSDNFNTALTIDHYYNRIDAANKISSIFLSLDFRYKLSKVLELNLKGSNLLNQKVYEYTVLNDASFTNNSYTLRPLNILAGLYFSW